MIYNSIVLRTIALSVLLVFVSCQEEKQGCTDNNSFNYNPEAKKDNGSCKEMKGCLGYRSGYTNSGTLGTSLYHPYYDQAMNEEVGIQRTFFNGIPASVLILYEPDYTKRNAYALPTGQIHFGYFMFQYIVNSFNELAVAGILAHEWGHRTQQTLGWIQTSKNPEIELEADAFSGYYMALAKSYAWSQIQGYFASTYAAGDYNFNSPQHHGTPNQRIAAAYLGVQKAVDAVNNGQPYSYEQLHTIFLTTIKDEILTGKKSDVSNSIYRKIAIGESKGVEISVSKNLSNEVRRNLFPVM